MNDFGQPVNPLGEMKNQGRNKRTQLNVYSITDIQATTTSRTLDSTYVAHETYINIATGYPGTSGLIYGNPIPMVLKTSGITTSTDGFTSGTQSIQHVGGGGTYYYDGTNWFIWRENVYMNATGAINYYYLVKRMAGSITYPSTTHNLRSILLSPSIDFKGGIGGGDGTPSGNYVYIDTFYFDVNGNLISSSSGSYRLGDIGDENIFGR